MKEVPDVPERSLQQAIVQMIKKIKICDLLWRVNWFILLFPAISELTDKEPWIESWLCNDYKVSKAATAAEYSTSFMRSTGRTEMAIPPRSIRKDFFFFLFQDWTHHVMLCATWRWLKSACPLKFQDKQEIVKPVLQSNTTSRLVTQKPRQLKNYKSL